MISPYKAYEDAELLGKLEELNSTYIKLDKVDEYGGLGLTITSCTNTRTKVRVYIDADGLRFGRSRLFSVDGKTYILLSAISAAYAAGYAAARQFYERMIHDNKTETES